MLKFAPTSLAVPSAVPQHVQCCVDRSAYLSMEIGLCLLLKMGAIMYLQCVYLYEEPFSVFAVDVVGALHTTTVLVLYYLYCLYYSNLLLRIAYFDVEPLRMASLRMKGGWPHGP